MSLDVVMQIAETMLNWASAATTITILATAFLVWQIAVRIYREARLAYWHRKIPSAPVKTLLSKLVGAPFFDYYPSIADKVSPEKCKPLAHLVNILIKLYFFSSFHAVLAWNEPD